mmetsp:Transcript_23643/g.41988  ORF Transcript_23643/g.41988 Transcript_23643/m.41988 type:complete len:244 (-) Transcript_23643:2741-3472(-)
MIDFHCHLDLYRYPEIAIEDAAASGVYVLCVTTTPKAWKQTAKMCATGPRIRTALGLHPELVAERATELPLFEHFAKETKYFGEVGLDGSPEMKRSQGIQEKVFSSILRVAAKHGGRVLSIHSRRAAESVLDAIAREKDAGTPVLHWFSGNAAELKRAIEMGCWFSCGPSMLGSKKGQEIASLIPKDKILTETDGPFAKFQSKPLQPIDSWRAVEMLSNIWKTPMSDVQHTLKRNLKTVAQSI